FRVPVDRATPTTANILPEELLLQRSSWQTPRECGIAVGSASRAVWLPRESTSLLEPDREDSEAARGNVRRSSENSFHLANNHLRPWVGCMRRFGTRCTEV